MPQTTGTPAVPAPAMPLDVTQARTEVLELMRAEIGALRLMVEARLAELETLTRQFDALAEAETAGIEARMATVSQRHAVDLVLAERRFAGWRAGPAPGVPGIERQISALAESALFDSVWYRASYPDVGEQRMTPIEHYVRIGAFEGRNPGSGFDTMAYYLANPDVATAGWPALSHYVMFGAAEGRRAG